MIGNTGTAIFSNANCMVPNEGVVPPSAGLSQSSILSAPACAAAIAEEMLKQAISNKGD